MSANHQSERAAGRGVGSFLVRKYQTTKQIERAILEVRFLASNKTKLESIRADSCLELLDRLKPSLQADCSLFLGGKHGRVTMQSESKVPLNPQKM